MKGFKVRFQRKGAAIHTYGIDFGPEVVIVAETGKRMLWKVPGHKVWSGNGQPWRHYGAQYLAVEVRQRGVGDIIRTEQPGRDWRGIAAEMKAWVEAAP